MKVTPLEIRQKAFEKNFRGYDKDEVEAFLLSLSQEWEKLLDKNKEMTLRLETASRELEKLHEVESTLYKTLKTAEDTGKNILEQAKQKAALKKRESELDAEMMVNEAKAESTQMIEDAEIRSDQILSEAESDARVVADGMMEMLREMEFHYREVCEARDGVIADLQHMTDDLSGRMEKATAQKKQKQVNLEAIMERARKSFRQRTPNHSEEEGSKSKREGIVEKSEKKELVAQQKETANVVAETIKKNHQEEKMDEESFFDQIG